jgi:hypothetical protein
VLILPVAMKKISCYILIIVLFLMNIGCNGQEKNLIHAFEPTASDFRIMKWNLKKNENSDYYLTEKIDLKNRVTELKFYKEGKNDFDHLCYLQTWIKYEYPNDTTIIQTNLNNKGIPEANI